MKTVKCFLLKLYVALLVAGFSPVLVIAQISNLTGETRNNTTTLGYQTACWWSLRTVAVQPDGGYIIVWIDEATNDGQGTGIYGQRFNTNGSKAGSEFLVNTTTSGSQYSPAISVAPDGSFLVAWEGPGSSIDIFAQKFSKNGVKDGIEFLLNTSVSGNQRYPEIQYYPDGTFVTAFVDGSQTILQRFDTDNRTIGQETRINSAAGNVVLDGFCVRADNSVVLFWTAGADVYGQLFDYNLNGIGSAQRLNTYTTGTQQYVLGRTDAAGNIVFAWESDGQDGSGNGVYYRRYDKNFTPLSASEIAITTNTTGDQFGPTVAVEPGGRFILSWSDNNNRDGGGGSPLLAGPGASIWFREFNSIGTAVGAETLINQSVTGYQGYSLVDVNASGKIVFAWEGNGTLAGNIDDVGSFNRTYQFSQSGINASMTVSPTSVIASDVVTVTMTLSSATTINNVIPNPLAVSGTNGVFATLVSGPTPASATVGLTPVNFTWTYRITAEEQSGTISFGGNARTATGVIFPYNSSNTINVKPALFVSDMTAPNLVCDANSPLGGPQAFTIGARVTNGGLTNLTNVYAYLGDGTTAGTFPTTTMTLSQTNNTYQGTFALMSMGGLSECTRNLVSLGAAKNVIAGSIDFNGDGIINTLDDGILSNGKTVIDGRIDVNLNGAISTTDDYNRPPGVFSGYREPAIIDGYVDTNNDGVISALDNSTYGGETKMVYWQVKYDVRDALNEPTFGNASDFNDDLRYSWKVWVSGHDGTATRTDAIKEFAKVRAELSAAANKMVPSPNGFISSSVPRVIAGSVDVNFDGLINTTDDGVFYGKNIIDGKVDVNNSGTITTADDGVINTYFPVIDGFIDIVNDGVINSTDIGLIVIPGQTVSITFNNATFGSVGGGFDENRDNLFDYDMWHQPIGKTDWRSNAFRLVDIKSFVTGAGGGNPLNGITTFYDNEPYLSRLIGDQGGTFDITYTYTFLVLNYQSAFLTPYQEAASGTNNEKYNNDFPTVGVNIMSLPPFMVLPSTGLHAGAMLTNKTAQVSWKTETEVNSKHFILERSVNGTDFAALTTVEAKGNSVVKSEYQYPDNLSNINQKVVYYRIKQVDLDGKTSYSNIVPVRLTATAEIAVWPNPFINNITVNINSPLPDVVTLSVYDMSGKIVAAKKQNVAAGNNQLQLNGFEALPIGVYTLNVTGGLLQKSFMLKKD